jgi:Rps23 Pro-64 3,4-dihydroxylase Tpa1-like proline 4-hydroxylase
MSSKNIEGVSHKEYVDAKPFSHASILDVFNETKLQELLIELETQEYYVEDHDLYQFLRTTDFKHTKNTLIKEFREFIFSDTFVNYIEKITALSLAKNTGDLHSLKLIDTQYLLCHDDQVQGRAVAFVLNLSEDWSKDDGGGLDLFSIDSQGQPKKVVTSIVPKFNQFNLFTVSSKSFHQISEVLSEHKERISISGWFYLDTKEKGAFEESPKK